MCCNHSTATIHTHRSPPNCLTVRAATCSSRLTPYRSTSFVKTQPQLCRRGLGPPVRESIACHAKKPEQDEVGSGLASAGSFLSSALESGAALVPDTVPRPLAKGGVAVVGGLVLFGLLKQLLSGLLTLAVMGGVAYWWLTKGDPGSEVTDIDVKPSARGGKDDEDLDDPLSEARKIMNKYK
ncbi:uncharacterized protein HaLaN_08806 [Haematococcus lacustris]|uniref:Uncharacterized protein n=1 Tax=Haematococcus lacustris TaxID=44745 RepID=A0A699Z073_HAELA|nr:uncharacterized protein HaLaN_08806 [Haematococcus lacustris]